MQKSTGTEMNALTMGLDGDPPRTIRDCLGYLYIEAMQHDLRLAAHLIGAAEECLTDLLDPAKADSRKRCKSGNGQKQNAKSDKED